LLFLAEKRIDGGLMRGGIHGDRVRMANIETVRISVLKNINHILERLEADQPGIIQNGASAVLAANGAINIAAFIFTGAGIFLSLTGIGALGIAGYTAECIDSGMAVAGFFVSGGTLASLGILTSVPAALKFLGYKKLREGRRAGLIRSLTAAIDELSAIGTNLEIIGKGDEFSGEIFHLHNLIESLSAARDSLTARRLWL